MNRDKYEQKKERLREERPVDMEFLSCSEAPHFVGYEIERAVDENLDYIPVQGEEDGLSFHCEIKLFQEEKHDGEYVCFRHIGARLKHGEFVDWQADGIPEDMEQEFRKRVLIMYRVMYPNGLTVEMMRQ